MSSHPHDGWKRALALLLLGLVALPSAILGEDRDTSALAPEAAQTRTTKRILALLGKTHYRPLEVDDALSGRLLDRYLAALDPGRVHFLASDIEEFDALREKLDDELRENVLGGAFLVFNRFQRRRFDRLRYLDGVVASGLEDLDFGVDEWLLSDRRKAAWPADIAAAKDLWRRSLKADVIGLKLAGRSMDEIQRTLARRYEVQRLRARKTGSCDVFGIYMKVFAKLHDPHTTYLTPREAERLRVDTQLSVTGIGAAFRSDGEYTSIGRLIAGGAAEKSGRIQPGDRITGIAQGDEGEILNVVGWRRDEIIEEVRGPKGTVVRLDILAAHQPRGGPTHVVRLVRDVVKLVDRAATSRILEVGREGKKLRVGVIRLPGFYMDLEAERRGDADLRSSSRDVARILADYESKGVKAVILDLRNNGGGVLEEAVRLTGLFVGRRPIVAVRFVGTPPMPRPGPKDAMYEGPLLLLVNRLSASASEIVAGAIQDYGRGIVVGGTTYGKGTVQQLEPLDRGQLKLTRAKYYRVSGRSTQGRGIVPDVRFPARFDNERYGESTRKGSLPWDSIPGIKPTTDREFQKSLPSLIRRHQDRVAVNPDFVYARDRQALKAEVRKSTRLSLDLEQRRKAQAKMTARLLQAENKLRAAKGMKPLESPAATRDEDVDAWTREAANILADVISAK